MGKTSRTKGRAFEQLVANMCRAAFPGRTVRRGKQSHLADEPDVVVEGVPLWIECQHADRATPAKKMEQAVKDSYAQFHKLPPIPVVVWRRTGSREVLATIRLGDLSIVALNNLSDHYLLATVSAAEFFMEAACRWPAPPKETPCDTSACSA
jgi:hypothetical protein